MKTFLGFMTGLLGGTILGIFIANYAAVTCESLREFYEKESFDL